MSSSYDSRPLRDEDRSRRHEDDRRHRDDDSRGGRHRRDDSSPRRYANDNMGDHRRDRHDDRGRDYHPHPRRRSRSRERDCHDNGYDRDHRHRRHSSDRYGVESNGRRDQGRGSDGSGGGRGDRGGMGRYGPDRGSDNRRLSPSNGQRQVFPYYKVVKAPADEKLGGIHDDPRGEDPTKRITKKASSRGVGRNTESFDPASTLVRPDLRVQIGSSRIDTYNKPLKHDDVVIVPELFGEEDDWSIYYKLVEEMRALQAKEDEDKSEVKTQENEEKKEEDVVNKTDTKPNNNNKKNQRNDRRGGRGGSSSAKWIAWHEGAHLISKNPKGCPTYEKIVARLCEYFNIDPKGNVGTRFNWYRDSSDWKPFHHDSAAFNPQRARNQNITVGASFGAMRELSFIRAEERSNPDNKCRVYFPQSNNGVFSFGRDANIHWKHGVNALSPDEQDGKGRISIILWGLAKSAIEEEGSPPLLGADGKGPHANGRNNGRNGERNRRKNGHRDSRRNR